MAKPTATACVGRHSNLGNVRHGDKDHSCSYIQSRQSYYTYILLPVLCLAAGLTATHYTFMTCHCHMPLLSLQKLTWTHPSSLYNTKIMKQNPAKKMDICASDFRRITSSLSCSISCAPCEETVSSLASDAQFTSTIADSIIYFEKIHLIFAV